MSELTIEQKLAALRQRFKSVGFTETDQRGFALWVWDDESESTIMIHPAEPQLGDVYELQAIASHIGHTLLITPDRQRIAETCDLCGGKGEISKTGGGVWNYYLSNWEECPKCGGQDRQRIVELEAKIGDVRILHPEMGEIEATCDAMTKRITEMEAEIVRLRDELARYEHSWQSRELQRAHLISDRDYVQGMIDHVNDTTWGTDKTMWEQRLAQINDELAEFDAETAPLTAPAATEGGEG